MLRRGTSRRAVSANIATETRAGRPPKQAQAIAFAEARREAKRTLLADEKGRGWLVTLTTGTVAGARFYDVEWTIAGKHRAHRRHETNSYQTARKTFDGYVREARKADEKGNG